MTPLPDEPQCPDVGWTADGRVISVRSGEEIEVEVRTRVRIRLADCRAADPSIPDGDRARDYLRFLAPVGSAVRVFLPGAGGPPAPGSNAPGYAWVRGREGASLSLQMIAAGEAAPTVSGLAALLLARRRRRAPLVPESKP